MVRQLFLHRRSTQKQADEVHLGFAPLKRLSQSKPKRQTQALQGTIGCACTARPRLILFRRGFFRCVRACVHACVPRACVPVDRTRVP